MKTQLLSIIFLLSFSFLSMAQTTTDEMKEFADSSFLQIDEIDVPPGLKRVEDQIRENVIDVIIHSKTHMPIFAQKRPEGYSPNYKKFNGLNIKIYPLKGDEDFYTLKLFYYNWTTNKFDKTLTKKISKYNVLNELRFATYEILRGKEWVRENKDNIEKRNFERIEAVRQVLDEQKKMKKKKDLVAQKKESEEEEKKEIKRNLLKREEKNKKTKSKENDEEDSANEENALGKKNIDSVNQQTDEELEKVPEVNQTKTQASSNARKKAKNKNSDPEEVEPNLAADPNVDPNTPPDSVPKVSHFYGLGGYFQESVKATGLVPASTDLKYVGIGGRFILERKTSIPTGLRFSLMAAMPVFKEHYSFPIYRSIESEGFASFFDNQLRFYAGLDFVPLYFVGLPSEGAGLQVFENDFLWGKAGVSYSNSIFDHQFEVRFSYLKSLLAKSNQQAKFAAVKTQMNIYVQVHNKHGAELGFSTTKVSGLFDVDSKNIVLSYIYKFEN